MRRIETEKDVNEGLDRLAAGDPRLLPVIKASGPVPLRRSPGGLEGLARIVVSQQVSVASAQAIWGRTRSLLPSFEVETVLAAPETVWREAGLSAPKIRTLRAVAEACHAGLDLHGLAGLPIQDAHAKLVAIKGIGPWTADIYLLFCVGHGDIFPVGDLALRHAVADAFDLDGPIPIDELGEIAAAWSPWRGVAARLFWSYYRATRNKAGIAGDD